MDSATTTCRDAIYNALCAMDNQDVALEESGDRIVAALIGAGFRVVPNDLPFEVLGDAAIAGVFETGNPKHGWDYLLARVAVPASIEAIRIARYNAGLNA